MNTILYYIFLVTSFVCIPMWISYDLTQEYVKNDVFDRCMIQNNTKTVIDATLICSEIVYGDKSDKK